jgi:RNA polymerase sigma factor (sigma-70 family)
MAVLGAPDAGRAGLVPQQDGTWLTIAEEPHTFEELYTRYRDPLVRYIRFRCSPALRPLVEDFVAQAYTNVLGAWGRVAQYAGPAQFKYLTAVLQNLVRDEGRRRRHAPHQALSLDVALAEHPVWLANQCPRRPRQSAEESILDLEDALEEREAVHELYRRALAVIATHSQPAYRAKLATALTLAIAGYPSAEIAYTLGITAGGLKRLLPHLARSLQLGHWTKAPSGRTATGTYLWCRKARAGVGDAVVHAAVLRAATRAVDVVEQLAAERPTASLTRAEGGRSRGAAAHGKGRRRREGPAERCAAGPQSAVVAQHQGRATRTTGAGQQGTAA